MKSLRVLTTLIVALVLTGCANLTPTQRKVLAVGAAIVVAGAISANNANHHNSDPLTCGGALPVPQ